MPRNAFAAEAEHILGLPIKSRVHELGGYGPAGEVIYEGHPLGCPTVLVAAAGAAKATFQSNGSTAFEVRLPDGLAVAVLSASFDAVEKRETGPMSHNLWLDLGGGRIAALVNPRVGGTTEPRSIRVVKLGDPARAMWFCARFRGVTGAVRLSLASTAAGPALLRETYIRNEGPKPLRAALWSFFNLHGTQRFVYNKEIWYDAGLVAAPGEIVAAATVPYSEIVQLKRVSARGSAGLGEAEATCDYSAFVGDSAATAALPEAVRRGRLLAGAGKRLNRFSIATIAARRFALGLAPGRAAVLQESLLYVADARLAARFRAKSSCRFPDYPRVERAFLSAAKDLLRRTPGARETAEIALRSAAAARPPAFELYLPAEPVMTEYARSVWTGVQELYENCRAHGARLADGIELGTRDRAQDMWPKMKEDPARVREDLVHALGFMYVTNDSGKWSRPMTLAEKLHGMFPRQYPSRWTDRAKEVLNDNRPYADSPLWLLNALAMYVRETGDCAILAEKVPTVRLTRPETPESSGMVGGARELSVAEVALEVLECFGRHVADSPYGLAQVMYGDWCDPVDMFGTSAVGDAATRARGRGAQVRLSAHLFECLVEAADLFAAPAVRRALGGLEFAGRVAALKRLAAELRGNIIRWAWEAPRRAQPAGFLAAIHELRADGSRPDYSRGETGYTLGSMRGRDFDGLKRRELTAQAYGLKMLLIDRDWLPPAPERDRLVRELLAGADAALFDARVGLRLFSRPMANSETSRRLVGRMGVLPAGCAENGEYHHAQAMMGRNRMLAAGEASRAWAGFRRIVSATRDATLAGPFDMPATSCAADPADPHFGKGMYFGLSGSTDWIVEMLQEVAGVRLALHDERGPALRVEPRLPESLGGQLAFRRIIHAAKPGGGYRQVPLAVEVRTEGAGSRLIAERVTVNGRPAPLAEVRTLDGLQRVEIIISRQLGR